MAAWHDLKLQRKKDEGNRCLIWEPFHTVRFKLINIAYIDKTD